MPGPYRISLTTTPQAVTGVRAVGDLPLSVVMWAEADWTVGDSDMTAANGATPGMLVKAGTPYSTTVRPGQRKYAAAVTGTTTLHRDTDAS